MYQSVYRCIAVLVTIATAANENLAAESTEAIKREKQIPKLITPIAHKLQNRERICQNRRPHLHVRQEASSDNAITVYALSFQFSLGRMF